MSHIIIEGVAQLVQEVQQKLDDGERNFRLRRGLLGSLASGAAKNVSGILV